MSIEHSRLTELIGSNLRLFWVNGCCGTFTRYVSDITEYIHCSLARSPLQNAGFADAMRFSRGEATPTHIQYALELEEDERRGRYDL